jgi:chemotaxis response regulator CheB
MPPIRVLIVDDSVVIRQVLSELLLSDPEIEIAGTASSGALALSLIPQLKPDLVTLDLEMPGMDGLETLAGIRKLSPKLPVIMFSTFTERGAAVTLEALARGATDYVTKPTHAGNTEAARQRVREELIPKNQVAVHAPRVPPTAPARRNRRPGTCSRSDRYRRDRDVNGRPECAGRPDSAIPGNLSGSDRDRAAHAAHVHVSTRRASQCAHAAACAGGPGRKEASNRAGLDRARRLPHDGGPKGERCRADDEPALS